MSSTPRENNTRTEYRTVYIADDGTEFNAKTDAEHYELTGCIRKCFPDADENIVTKFAVFCENEITNAVKLYREGC